MKNFLHLWSGRVLSIFDDDISIYAASLSFYSILSIIPMLWVLFFMLHQFGVFEEYYTLVESFLMDSLIPAHAESVAGLLQQFIGNASSMGGMGLLYSVITSILFYKNYQFVVNKIYLVPDHSILHSLVTYLILALLMPMTLGLSFYLSDYIQNIVESSDLIIGEFTLISYLMIWVLFFLLFKISPNMRINIGIALKVSFLAALVWHVAKWLFVQYMFINQVYSTLYGSFSALLFLLVWLYLSWLLLLHGLRACYLMHCQQGKYT